MFWSTKFVCFIFSLSHRRFVCLMTTFNVNHRRMKKNWRPKTSPGCGSKCHLNHVRITGAKWSRVAMQKCLQLHFPRMWRCHQHSNSIKQSCFHLNAPEITIPWSLKNYTYSEKQGHREIAFLLVTDSCLIALQQAHRPFLNGSCFLSWLALSIWNDRHVQHVHNWQDMAMDSYPIGSMYGIYANIYIHLPSIYPQC